MVISGTKLLWNEWSDDLSFVNPQGDLTFTKIGKCTAPAAQGPNKTKNLTD
jgi:hypothetical protein